MRMFIWIAAVLVVLWSGLAASQDRAAGPEPATGDAEQSTSFWMRSKVDESQAIFAALAEAEFESVLASAEKLQSVSRFEGFVRRGLPGYRTQLQTFRFAAHEIADQARQRNIEGVALGFHQLTLSCVNCHKRLRDADGASGSVAE